MTDDQFNLLCNVYNKCCIPVIICDKYFKFLWNNAEYDSDDFLNKRKDKFELWLTEADSNSSICDFYVDNRCYFANIIRYEDYLIIGMNDSHSTKFKGVLSPVDHIMKNLMARIRTSVSSIAVATDEVYKTIVDAYGCSSYTANQLNIIEGNLALLLKDMLVPEQLVSTYLDNDTDRLVNITQLIELLKNDFHEVFDDGSIEFESSCEPDIFTCVSNNALQIVVCNMISEILSFHLQIEKLSVNVFIDKDENINFIFTGTNLSGKKTKFDSDYIDMLVYVQIAKPNSFLLSSFMSKYNATFQKSETYNTLCQTLKLPVNYGDEHQVSLSPINYSTNRRFNPLTISLSYIKKKTRYTPKEKGEIKK